MAAIPVTIVGVSNGEPVVIIGMASLTGLSVGGGPITPPPIPTHPIFFPPGTEPHPEHPIVIPPPPIDVPPPNGGGEVDVIKPPPDSGGWGYFEDYGWGYFPGGSSAGPKSK